jgi:multidrug transporter EmrE-like cation transporter
MTPSTLIFLLLAGMINAAGSGLLKYASQYRSLEGSKPVVGVLLFIGAMALYGGCFPLYSISLSRTSLAVAQPIFAAVTFVCTLAISVIIFRNALGVLQMTGVALIMTGIVMVSLGGR